MAELKQVYPIASYFVGGHSQGGFLTYSLLMNFPESMAGAFPMSCRVIFQCEPDVYADKTLCRAQRTIPLDIIHGKNDPVMGFRMGQYASTLFAESGWPAIQFFTDETAGHMFARLPVEPAIRWLEAHASNDPARLIDFANSRFKQKAYRDAIAALRRARMLAPGVSQNFQALELGQSIDALASGGAAKYLSLIRQANNNSWLDDFLTFRDDFEFAGTAQEVMTAFASLRAEQQLPAQKMFGEANQLFQQGKEDEGYQKYREIIEKFSASSLYRHVKRWLSERK
jgi:hypothetical protein